MTNSIYWQTSKISQEQRQNRNNHKSFVLWFTGLSNSGKSTIATALEKKIFDSNHNVVRLDGDNIRHGLSSDLSFTKDDRRENNRRVAEVAKLFTDAGTIVLAAFISPYQDDRNQVRNIITDDKYLEIFCDCDLSVCEERDTKGQYERAKKGEIENFTGISAPYEKPIKPDLVLNSETQSVEQELNTILDFLKEKQLISI